jgi:hypothetical protein
MKRAFTGAVPPTKFESNDLPASRPSQLLCRRIESAVIARLVGRFTSQAAIPVDRQDGRKQCRAGNRYLGLTDKLAK